MIPGCPGAAAFRGTPTLAEKKCPVCGLDIELFSIEPCNTCKCGFTAYNDAQSCIKWCAYAKECVGEEIYNLFMSIQQQEEGENSEESVIPAQPVAVAG